ncbi:glutamate:Na+ symporter, ESS family [Melghirimyces thermohalophilus]|uniref:Glutamate:Na+ symporter, ESS family n=1 Tax=Melghirimyces thermohalophilus TaxID=1236220 RepID=A0A1G6RGW6_9BACL|nr:sodium/glutamate symporter [Melghirimyces thermohalophilus]SDD03623.1 glutamate:Na+ symporter, ESS family [Melghirimyces thermohalophilus]
MKDFSLWYLFIDIGLISMLLLMGTFLRAKIRMVQSLFLPASIIAGGLGLILGPNGFQILPFTSYIAEYPEVLIAVIFGAIPVGAAKVRWSQTFKRVRNMWLYSMLLTTLMWGGGALFGYIILSSVWDLPDGFGLILGAGFVGGHGTAAAIGQAYSSLGWDEAMSLGFTSATVGIISSIVGGLILIKSNARKNQTQFIKDIDQLPEELRTGLIKEEKRKSMGDDTVSSISIDPIVFHFSVISVIVLIGYYLQEVLGQAFPNVSLPLLSLAYVVGLVFQIAFRRLGVDAYIDKRVVNRISGTATDLLVAFGMTSIKLSVVAKYAYPLILLFIFGLFWAWCIYRFIAPRVFYRHWFENALFGWGWSTGTVAMGMALLRIVDPDTKTTTLEDYSLGYIGMVPVELMIITFGPIMMVAGTGWLFTTIVLGVGITLFALAHFRGWLVSKNQMAFRTSGMNEGRDAS